LNAVCATILLVVAVLVISSWRGVPSAGVGYLLLAVSHILEALAVQYLSADLMLVAEGLRPAAPLVIGVGVGVRGGMGRRKYRSQAGIIYDVLRTVMRYGEVSVTHIMYGANLPFDRTKEVVRSLVSRGLLVDVRVNGRVMYRLTERGYEALKKLEKAKRLLEELGFKF